MPQEEKVLGGFGVIFCSFYLLWLGPYMQIEVLLGPLAFNHLHSHVYQK